MALTRWVGWAREMVRVLRGLPDEEIRKKTIAMHEQLIRLRRHRAEHEREREANALRDIRRIVEEMQTLERDLTEAEKATAEYVDTLAENVTKQMEEKISAEMDHLVNKAMTGEIPHLQKLAGSDKPTGTPKFESSPNKSKP